MSFFENIQGVFETQFGTLPRPEGGGSTGGAGDWNTLANRPFGYVEHYDLLPETAVQFSGSSPAIGGLALTSPLTEGKAYPVNFDGTQYLCRYESGRLGNLAMEDGTDTGEPFLWYVTESMILTTAGAGTHTVSLQGGIPQRVPYEYLPFGGDTPTVVLPKTIVDVAENDGHVMGDFSGVKWIPSVGVVCSVEYNGTIYNSPLIAPGGDGIYCIGNLGTLGLEDTGEPFAIILSEEGYNQLVVFEAVESVVIKITAPKAELIPSELLPTIPVLNLNIWGTLDLSEPLEGIVTLFTDNKPYIIVKQAAANGFIKLLTYWKIKTTYGYETIEEVMAMVHYDKTWEKYFITANVSGNKLFLVFQLTDPETCQIECSYTRD